MQAEGRKQRQPVAAAVPERFHGLPKVRHQQMARHGIEEDDSQHEQAGADEAEDHIPHRGQGGPANLADHEDAASRDRADLDEDIAGKQVVRVAQRLQRNQHQVQRGVIEIRLFLV